MAKDSSTLFLLGGGALVVWYGYTQGWFASLGFAPAAAATGGTVSTANMATLQSAINTAVASGALPAASGTALVSAVNSGQMSYAQALSDVSAPPSQPTSTSTAIGPSTPIAAVTATVPALASPGYNGPSLASMLSALQAQLAQNAGDPALSSSGGTVSAVCDVFNYYLVAANVGVSDGMLQCSDHSTAITVAQYWAWAAPQLQAKIPGLSGLGNVYAGLGELVRMTKRGW